MPFPFCGKKNKGDAKDPPYSKAGIEDATAKLLEEERETVRLARQESMRYKDNCNKLKKDLEESRKQLEESRKEADRLRGLSDQVKKYERQLSDVEKERKALASDKVELENKVKSSVKDKADSVQSEIARASTSKLESDLLNLQNVKGKIEEERDSAQKNLSELESKYKGNLADLEAQIQKIGREKDEAEDRYKKAKEDADEKIKTVKHEKDKLENDLAHTKKQLEIAKKESHIPRSPTGSADEMLNKVKAAEAELKKERDQRLEKEKDLSRLASEKDQLAQEKDEILQEIHSMQTYTDDLKRNKDNSEKSLRSEMDRMKADYKQLISEKDAANDELLTRLSSITAAQVLDGNPDVSDISDPNRPQKLVEQLCSLYDDQWTDASDELEKIERFKNDEQLLVTTLFELVKATYIHCKESSESQLSRIEEHIFLPPMENPPPLSPDTNGTDTTPAKSPTPKQSASKIPRYSSFTARGGQKDADPGKDKEKKKRSNASLKMKGEKVPEVPVEVRRGIKEYRKVVAKQVIPVIEKELFQKLRSGSEFDDDVIDACKPFITKAVAICWRMCIQDPPVCLKWDIPNDKTFNPERYRTYTCSGSHVEYVVWPIVYLHESGDVIMKGVAQGITPGEDS